MKDPGKPMKSVVYDSIRSSMQTFDILLWSGTGNLSRFIQLGTGSPWSHVAMVIRTEPDLLLLWESTITDDCNGVQLTPLSQNIHGKLAYRKLNLPAGAPLMSGKLQEARELLNGRPFESSWLEFIKAGYDGPFGHNTKDITTLFCAELVAETFIICGLLDENKPSNEYTPKDFSSEGSLDLWWGATLDEEVLLLPGDKSKKQARALLAKQPVIPNARGLVCLP